MMRQVSKKELDEFLHVTHAKHYVELHVVRICDPQIIEYYWGKKLLAYHTDTNDERVKEIDLKFFIDDGEVK